MMEESPETSFLGTTSNSDIHHFNMGTLLGFKVNLAVENGRISLMPVALLHAGKVPLCRRLALTCRGLIWVGWKVFQLYFGMWKRVSKIFIF
jgi:hypothetical protein